MKEEGKLKVILRVNKTHPQKKLQENLDVCPHSV
jgi:hypothetical protein